MELNSFQLLTAEYLILALGLLLCYKCFSLKLEIMKLFKHFVVILVLFLLVNVPIRYIELHLVSWNPGIVKVLYDVSILLMTVSMYFWCLFVLMHIDSALVSTQSRRFIAGIPACIIIPFLIINRFTGWLYTIDEMGWYHRGSIFVLQALISYMYFFVLVFHTIYHIIINHNRAEAIKCIISLIPALAGAALQQFFGGSYLLAGTTICALTMYVEICLERQRVYELENSKIHEIHAREMKKVFTQTAEALSDAVDAKDPYTHGHSVRVARYSRDIAKTYGYTPEECDEVFFAGLLHDVGKIGVRGDILNKSGKLTPEEYEQIKQHSVFGKQILARIDSLPSLSLGAGFHHERYDGKGYPNGLKGTDIPWIARIISVADAYDAMTSKRSYRDPLPQQTAREELLLGSGTQFDPEFTKIMIHLIDTDLQYHMKEKQDRDDYTGTEEITCDVNNPSYTKGTLIDSRKLTVHFSAEKLGNDTSMAPAFFIFDSLDGYVHTKKTDQEALCFLKYCEVNVDGSYKCDGARVLMMEVERTKSPSNDSETEIADYELTIFRQEDHLYAELASHGLIYKITIALPDCTRYSYLTLTGKNCRIFNISMERADEEMAPNSITRIAEKNNFIEMPEGDIPNVQIDGWRTTATKGLLLKDELQITFHTKTLPFGRLIWHCPFIVLYSSEDGTVNGPDYTEYALMRIDGECWHESPVSVNDTVVERKAEFTGWDDWKAQNKKGRTCIINLSKNGDQILTTTSNSGINLKNTTSILNGQKKIYVAITGDECVVEAIHVISGI